MATVLEQFVERHCSVAGNTKKLALHLLDTLGAGLAAVQTDDSVLLTRLIETKPGMPAALNGGLLDRIAQCVAIIRNSEIDDIHMVSCTTPGSIVVPVALTLARALEKPRAKVFATALSAGYEAMTRFGLAVSGATIRVRGIWPTLFAAPFSAAATASIMLGLDPEQTADALAMALTLSSGAPGGHGAGTARWIVLGQAGRAGVFAALTAAAGIHGDRTLLDGDWLERTLGVALDRAPLVTLGEAPAIDTISYKPYCSAKQAIAAIEGFRRILSLTTPDQLASVRVYVPPTYARMIGEPDASKGRLDRIAGVAYQLALAAYRPTLLTDVIRPDLSREPDIASFMPRVQTIADSALAPYFPTAYPARVEATAMGDGSTISELVTDATGDPSSGFGESDVCSKFLGLATPVLGHPRAEELAASALDATQRDDALATLVAATDRTNPFGEDPGHGPSRQS